MSPKLETLLREHDRLLGRIERATRKEFAIGSRWHFRCALYRSVSGPAEVVAHGPTPGFVSVVLVADLERCRNEGREPNWRDRHETSIHRLAPLLATSSASSPG